MGGVPGQATWIANGMSWCWNADGIWEETRNRIWTRGNMREEIPDGKLDGYQTASWTDTRRHTDGYRRNIGQEMKRTNIRDEIWVRCRYEDGMGGNRDNTGWDTRLDMGYEKRRTYDRMGRGV